MALLALISLSLSIFISSTILVPLTWGIVGVTAGIPMEGVVVCCVVCEGRRIDFFLAGGFLLSSGARTRFVSAAPLPRCVWILPCLSNDTRGEASMNKCEEWGFRIEPGPARGVVLRAIDLLALAVVGLRVVARALSRSSARGVVERFDAAFGSE